MIRQDQLEQSELEMSSASKRLYLERCAVSGAAGLALERQGTPARPAAAPGSSLSYPGYCDKTQAGEGNCDVSNKGSLRLKPPEGLQACLDKCRGCARCNYITFSEKYSAST